MSTANLRNIMRVRGRLVANPTDISLASPFPYGGTPLGLVRDAEFQLNVKTKEVLAEEFGNTPVEIVYGGERAVFMAVLRDYDKNAVAAIFPNAATFSPITSPNDMPLFRYRPAADVASRPGMLLSTKAVRLLFAPDAEQHHPFFLMYKAIPHVQAAASLQLALGEELGIAVAFVGVPDSTASGKVYEFGAKGNISLV